MTRTALFLWWNRANVRLSRREWDLETRKTKAMASKEAELEAKGYGTWVQAREASDFGAFAPVLCEIFELKGEVAKATRPDRSAYDSNLDQFEVNMTHQRLGRWVGATPACLHGGQLKKRARPQTPENETNQTQPRSSRR